MELVVRRKFSAVIIRHRLTYVDFTASMGWEYVSDRFRLADEWKEEMLKDIVRYANSKGVGIFLWYHSGMGREKDTLSMANLMAFPESRRKEIAEEFANGE